MKRDWLATFPCTVAPPSTFRLGVRLFNIEQTLLDPPVNLRLKSVPIYVRSVPLFRAKSLSYAVGTRRNT
jgi:hypothetical protein